MPSHSSDDESDDDYGPAPAPVATEAGENPSEIKSNRKTKRKQEDAITSESSKDNEKDAKKSLEITENAKKKPKTITKKRIIDPYESIYLQQLPSSEHYETSYMHRDIVTHTCVSKVTEFIITASNDGHVKFWKKMLKSIEFVKHYQAHLGPITDMILSPDGKQLVTVSTHDSMIKVFDILSFDMINMIEITSFSPRKVIWLENPLTHLFDRIAVTDTQSGKIFILKAMDANGTILQEVNIHSFPVVCLERHPIYHQVIISIDSKGMIEYWDTATLQLPSSSSSEITFHYKSETDLFELMKVKTLPISMTFSHSGQYFAIFSLDKQIRIFNYITGKLFRQFNESLMVYNQMLQELNQPPLPPPPSTATTEGESGDLPEKEEGKEEEDTKKSILPKLDALDLGRRIALEKELESNIDSLMLTNLLFDQSDHILIYSSLLGIKMINILTEQVIRIIGYPEKTERFLKLSLYQGIPVVDQQLLLSRQTAFNAAAASNSATNKQTTIDIQHKTTEDILAEANQPDPTIYITSFKKRRFYCFSLRQPNESTESRDKVNELPTEEEKQLENYQKQLLKSQQTLINQVILHTSLGDIIIKLFIDECPKTCENFITHISNGYYNNIIFHRVIKNFMIQTGDPLGDGTGGESIWGKEFEDEFHRTLRHDRPFTVSMANAGPNTNGSQVIDQTLLSSNAVLS